LALAVLALSSYPINVLAKFTIVHAVVLGAVFLLRRRVDWSMIAPAVLYWGGLTILFLPTFLPLLDFAEIASRTYQASSVAGTAGLMTAVFVDLPLTILKALVFVELFQIQVLLVACVVLLPFSRKARIAGLVYLVIGGFVGLFFSDVYHLASDSFLARMDLHFVKWALPFGAALLIIVAMSDVPMTARKARIGFLGLLVVLSAGSLIVFRNTAFFPPYYLVGSLIALFMVLAVSAGRPEIWRSALPLPSPAVTGALAIVTLAVVLVVGQQLRREVMVFDQELGPDPALTALLQQHEEEPFRVAVAEWHPTRAQFAGLETFGSASPLFSRRFHDFALRAAAPQFDDPDSRDVEVCMDGAGCLRGAKEMASSHFYHILMSDWHMIGPRLHALLPAELTAASWNLKVLAAGNVRYILSANPVPGLRPAPGILAGAAAGPEIRVYEVPEALPRAYLVPNLRTAPTGQALLDELESSSPATLRSTLWVEGEPPPLALESSSSEACGAVTIEHYTPDRITLSVRSLSPCYLVMVNNYDPLWSASVDGAPVPLFRANHAFQALTIAAAGDHRVEFRYQDRRFPLIFLLIPLGVLVIVLAPWSHSLGPRAKRAANGSGKASP
jgi:hypothetical protein